MSKQHGLIFRPLLTIGVFCVVCILWLPSLPASAALSAPQGQPAELLGMPPRPPTLTPTPTGMPPRPPTVTPTPTITATPTVTLTPRPSDDAGAIELKVHFLPGAPLEQEWRENLWTIVEWQDGLGNWHVVDGWQASLDEVKGDYGRKIWYVSEDLFGRGPFCWAVSPDPKSDPIAVSLPFRLPSTAGVIVQSDLAVAKPVPIPTRPVASESMAPVTGGGERRFTGLQVSLTVFVILLLVGSLLFKGSRRRQE